MMYRDVEAQYGAIAPAHNGRSLDLQIIHDGDHVRSHQVIPIGLLVAWAAAMSPAIHDDDPIALVEDRHLEPPIVRIGEAAVKKDHGFALAELRVPDSHPIDGGIAAMRRLRQAWRRRQDHPRIL